MYFGKERAVTVSQPRAPPPGRVGFDRLTAAEGEDTYLFPEHERSEGFDEDVEKLRGMRKVSNEQMANVLSEQHFVAIISRPFQSRCFVIPNARQGRALSSARE